MLVVDIETVPLMASLALPYPEAERQPPANYSKPDTIAAWREKDRAAWEAERVKQYSLNPRLGRILVIGTDEGPLVAATEDMEASMLHAFWAAAKAHGGQIITWNGHWDLRFIVVRSLAHGILPPPAPWHPSQWFRRYAYEPHFDCKAALLNWEVRVSGEGLEEWATFFNVAGKGGTSGADVWPMFQAGKLDEIVAYCQRDVAATKAVYDHIAPMFCAVQD